MPQLPGYYDLSIDIQWSAGGCHDCSTFSPAGAVVGFRPLGKGVSAVLCNACVQKELARRTDWVKFILPEKMAEEQMSALSDAGE